MQSVPVAVVQASLHKNSICVDCSSLLEGWVALHLCPKCMHPQPLKKEENFFEALGVSKRFGQDKAVLERNFYELSQALHPDRFTQAGPEMLQRSIQRMSFLNEAYRVLKNPASCREYLLQLEGVQGSGGGPSAVQQAKVPVELAEAWFEIQDLMFEDPATAGEKLRGFEQELQTRKLVIDQKVQDLESRYDLNADRRDQGVNDLGDQALLQELHEELRKENYLKSMQKDVDRIKKNAHSN